jgi:hypothetical protein
LLPAFVTVEKEGQAHLPVDHPIASPRDMSLAAMGGKVSGSAPAAARPLAA